MLIARKFLVHEGQSDSFCFSSNSSKLSAGRVLTYFLDALPMNPLTVSRFAVYKKS
jgi:hypothetical protein